MVFDASKGEHDRILAALKRAGDWLTIYGLSVVFGSAPPSQVYAMAEDLASDGLIQRKINRALGEPMYRILEPA